MGLSVSDMAAAPPLMGSIKARPHQSMAGRPRVMTENHGASRATHRMHESRTIDISVCGGSGFCIRSHADRNEFDSEGGMHFPEKTLRGSVSRTWFGLADFIFI
jgi:hypothetical protein